MTGRKPILSSVAAFALLLPIMLFAEQPRPFSAVELERFIGDWPDFARWAEDPRDDTAERLLAQRGWQAERFFYIAGQVAAGLVQLDAEDQGFAGSQQLDQQRSAIRESPHLTEAQKDELIASLGESSFQGPSATDSPSIAESELSLIRARRGELQRLLNVAY